MATTNCMRSLLWGVAMLAMLTVPAAAATGTAAQQETGAVERALRTRLQIGGQRSEIGVSVLDVEDAAPDAGAADEGAVVTNVRAVGPAGAAGMEPGDVIVEFDGERVRSARQLARLVEETPAGRDTPVRVLRGGSRVALSVTPAEGSGWRGRFRQVSADRIRVEVDEVEDRRAEVEERARELADRRAEVEERAKELAESAELTVLRRLPDVFRFSGSRLAGRVRLGIRAESVGGQLAEYFGTDAGVLVEHVDDGTTGAAAGLRAGDVITAVDGDAVDDLAALRRRLARLEPDAAFGITIVRDRTETSLTVEPPQEEEAEETPRPRRRGSAI